MLSVAFFVMLRAILLSAVITEYYYAESPIFCYAECCYDECRIIFDMMSVVMLRIVMLRVAFFVMLSVVMLSVVMLSVVMFSIDLNQNGLQLLGEKSFIRLT
jgi:hypothetical protein